MAAVLRPPLYVPRPAEIQPWVGAPTASLIIYLLAGPSGIVLSPQRHLDYVPPPDWQYSLPPNNNSLVAIAGTPFIPLQWEWNYDPAPNWVWEAPSSLAVRLPPQPTFFGAPGQVPAKLWRWDYEPDKVWNAEPFSDVTSFALEALKPFVAPLWVPQYQLDAPIWTWPVPQDLTTRIPASVTFFGAPGQAPTKLWRYDYDSIPFWTWPVPQPAHAPPAVIPPVAPVAPPIDQRDLDKGGVFRIWNQIWRGPSVGWIWKPELNIFPITAAGTYTLDPSTNYVTVNVAGTVTILLPSTKVPTGGAQAQPNLFAQTPVTIVDVGGLAGVNPITIMPFSGAETIMGLSQIQITTNFGGVTLAPLASALTWSMILP